MIRKVQLEEGQDLNKFPVRCFRCKKAPRNCSCTIYRIRVSDPSAVVADNIATMPLPNEGSLWQARRNARVWRRPQFVDGMVVLYILDPEKIAEVKEEIDSHTFSLINYRGREGFHVPAFDKALQKRLAIFRKTRVRKAKTV